MKKFFSLLGAALMMGLAFTSCITGESGPNTYNFQDFFTITGNVATGYTLYSDHGTYVTLDRTAFTNESGFGTAERVLMTVAYTEEMISADSKGLKNPSVIECVLVPTANALTLEEAAASKVTEADSLYNVNKLDFWAYRGYLTTETTAFYGNVRPTLNLVYDPITVRTDSIDLQLCYNIHKASPNYGGNYYTSFRLEPLATLIPGSGDVVMTVSCKGCNPVIVKVKRQDFYRGNYGL